MIARLIDGVPRRAPGSARLLLLAALIARAAVRRRLSAHRADPDLVLRLYRPGLEHHDGLCRAVVARPRALCRARRLYRGVALRAFRHRPVARPPGRGAGGGFGRRLHRLSGVSLPRRRRLFRHPDHRVRRIRARRLRSFELDQRIVGPVPAGRAIHPQRSLAPARPSGDVLLHPAGRDRARLGFLPRACCKAASAISGWRSARTRRPRARPASTSSTTR